MIYKEDDMTEEERLRAQRRAESRQFMDDEHVWSSSGSNSAGIRASVEEAEDKAPVAADPRKEYIVSSLSAAIYSKPHKYSFFLLYNNVSSYDNNTQK